MPDGIRLSARLWLPVLPDGETSPAIFEYIPYRKRDMVRARDERNHPYFARHGYASLRVDMRGSGDSEGVMTDMYGAAELDDALTVIDWIAGQAWCDGSVGMMGTSWGGTGSLQAAARQPEALRAVIAVCATDNRFDDDIHHMGGCILTDTVEWGATLPAILAAPPDPETVGPGWRPIWQERLESLSFPLENWVRHETRDAYWRWGAVNERPGVATCPALLIGGWADRYSNTVMNALAQSPENRWGIVGPWGHHYPDAAAPGPAIGFQREALRWWDRWLKGTANGVDLAPRLRVWIQGYDAPQDVIDNRSGRWAAVAPDPDGDLAPRDFWLTPGRLGSKPCGAAEPRGSAEPAIVPWSLAVGAAAGDTGYFGRRGGLPLAQQDDDALSLVFETDPLENALEIVGSVGFSVALESDQPLAVLVARLNDVPATGDVARVTYAVRNLALDEKGQDPRELVKGEVRSFVLRFPNTAYRFEKGHRIRLALSSSYWPIVWPSPKPARLALHLEEAKLTLPVCRTSAPEDPVSFVDANPADIEPSFVALSSPPLERRTSSDAGTNARTLVWHQPYKAVFHEKIALEFGFESKARHRISQDDPCSASSRVEHRLRVVREGWTVEVTGTAELTSSATDYRLFGRVEVRENGALVFERQWEPVVPRTCA